MELKDRYVVTCINDDDSRNFLAPDGSSGHMYWSGALSQARVYTSFEQAKQALGDSDFLKPAKMSNGAIHPPRLLQMAAGVNYNKPQGTATIALTKVQFEDVEIINNDVHINFEDQ